MCQFALQQGRKIPADTVHHIFPVDQYPEYAWCEWNLISLSADAHNTMHDRQSQRLSPIGEQLRRKVAVERGLEGKRTILVIGNPGTGKSTYVKQNLANGMAYDLDALAAALRLSKPKSESYKPARWLANDLLAGFTKAAHRYIDLVYVIRTAPTIEELETIEPTKLVVFYGGYGNKDLSETRRHTIAQRIVKCVEYAKANGIPVEEINCDE